MATCLERLKAYFAEQGVEYKVFHHPTVYTAQELASELHTPGGTVAKVFMVEADGQPVMLVLSAPDRVNLTQVREVLGAKKVQKAAEAAFGKLFPDCDTGAMPPFGHFYDVPVWLDRSLVEAPRIYFRAGTHRVTVALAGDDYRRLASPQVADFAFQS
ncbi:MAG: YbaK/EbsC family protein [Anaerolineae bacterium]|jgi:Ala-tRNA(Pro) deacylase